MRIAPIWDDLTTYSPDDIYVTSNSSYVAVRWAADTYGNSGTSVNVEAVLFANGNIEFNYGPSVVADSPTIGISAGNNSQFTLSRFDNATGIPADVSELFTYTSPLPPGLSLSSRGVERDADHGRHVQFVPNGHRFRLAGAFGHDPFRRERRQQLAVAVSARQCRRRQRQRIRNGQYPVGLGQRP